MKKYMIFFLIVWGTVISSCDMSSYDLPEPDGRLMGLTVEFKHVSPRTGQTMVNAFKDYYRKTETVNIDIKSNFKIAKIDVVNSVTSSVLKSVDVNGTEVKFSQAVEGLNIPFGQSASLYFHFYFDDKGVDGFEYPSMKSYTFNVISDIPSVVNFKKSDGSTVELKTTDVNIDKFSEDPKKGVVVSLKGGVNSFLRVENSPLLKFGANKNFSVSFWIQSDHDISDPGLMGTLDWDSSNNKGWLIAWLNGRIRVVAGDGAGTKTDFREGDDQPKLVGPEWNLITVVFDRTGLAELYRNGVRTASAAMKPVDIDTGGNVNINQDGTGNYGDKLRAKYSQVVFYDYALNAAKVTQIYNASK